MRFRFGLGLLAVLLVALGSVVVALVIRSNEVDHFHAQQTDEALRSARQAEAVAQLSVGELATAAAFFQAEPDLNRHEFEVVGNSLLRRGALTATAYIEKVPASERAAYEARNGFAIIERRAGLRPQRARARPVYYPVDLRRRRAIRTGATRLRPRHGPGARARPGTRRQNRQAGGDRGDAAAPRRRRDQRLPPRLPRRRADVDRRPSAKRRCSASPPAPSASMTWPPPRSRPSPMTSTSSSAPAGHVVIGPDGRPRRPGPGVDHDRRTGPGCWSSATPAGRRRPAPAGRGLRDLARGTARRPRPDLDLATSACASCSAKRARTR